MSLPVRDVIAFTPPLCKLEPETEAPEAIDVPFFTRKAYVPTAPKAVGKSALVMYPAPLVSWLLLVGTLDDVINPLSFVSWLVFVGTLDDVINPLLFVSWLVVVGTLDDVIKPLSFVSWLVVVGMLDIEVA